MKKIIKSLVAIIFIFSMAKFSFAGEARELSDEQWLADINQYAEAIKEEHFKAFTELSEAEFNLAVKQLSKSVPDKNDIEIMLGVAEITSKIRDGHTRVHLSRQYPEFALIAEAGHSGTPGPYINSLKLEQLPVGFELFEDGLFIVGASKKYQNLIGRKVIKFGKTETAEAIDRVAALSFFENESRAKLMAPDRLALPEVLAYLGIIENPVQIPLVLEDQAGNQTMENLAALSGSAENWVWGQGNRFPEKFRAPEPRQSYQVLSENDSILVSVAEFEATPDQPYSDFVHETMEAARKAGVNRYIIDLRQNSGGAGSWTTSFLRTLAASEYNKYGRLFILIGRVTFSASQKFINQFEEQTYAMLVGEPGGAQPSHFGDAKKIILENSGLTLRVSTIYWQSWIAGDFRKASIPHLDGLATSKTYFSGIDPALEAIYGYVPPETIGGQIAEQFKKGKTQNGAILFQRWLTDGDAYDHKTELPGLISVGNELLEEGQARPGYFMFFLINNFFPGIPEALIGLGRAHELMGSLEEAVKSYQAALKIDPENPEAKKNLERISSH